MKTIHILFVISSICRTGGGVSESARLLATAIAKKPGYKVTVLTLRTKYYDEDVKLWAGVHVIDSVFIGPSNYGFSLGMLWKALKLHPDLIHVHGLWGFHCFVVYLLSKIKSIPYIVSPHGMLEAWIMRRSRNVKKIVQWVYQDKFIANANYLHVLTNKEVIDLDGFCDRSKISIIPNFVSLEVDSVKPNWYVDSMADKIVFIFLGRIHEKKGWRELCEAWSDLCSYDYAFRDNALLVFCGWIDQSEDFHETVISLAGKYNNAIFSGAQYGIDKYRSLKAANFFLLPSKSEGLPMVVLESWVVGTPVLMSENCNLPLGFSNGAAINSGISAPSIGKAVRQAYYLKKSEFDSMRNAGLVIANEQYSETTVVKSFMALYLKAINI